MLRLAIGQAGRCTIVGTAREIRERLERSGIRPRGPHRIRHVLGPVCYVLLGGDAHLRLLRDTGGIPRVSFGDLAREAFLGLRLVRRAPAPPPRGVPESRDYVELVLEMRRALAPGTPYPPLSSGHSTPAGFLATPALPNPGSLEAPPELPGPPRGTPPGSRAVDVPGSGGPVARPDQPE